jgi:hypothetical protein
MNEYNSKYELPTKDCSCPDCGRVYGHHNTLVDEEHELCSVCSKERGYKDIKFVPAPYFINKLKD